MIFFTQIGGNRLSEIKKYYWLLFFLLALLSLYDLLLPQFTAPTILRQAQTAMLTENFVSEGFKIKGLYLNILGNEKPILALEFPIYNFIVGLLFQTFGASIFLGKLVSYLASTVSLACICRLINSAYDERVSVWAGVFFILSPVGMMMRTAFQPDSIALMCVLLSLVSIQKWYFKRTTAPLLLFSVSLLIGGLAKYPVMVPFLPLISLVLFTEDDRFKLPGIKVIVIVALTFVLPFLTWYLFRGQISDVRFASGILSTTFLIGDLTRFFHILNYVTPIYSVSILICSGLGILFFLFGLKRLSLPEKALLAGIPFYFVMIPTVMYQHYYLFACIPIFALFMSKGWLRFSDWCNGRQLVPARSLLLVLFTICFSFLSLYAIVLRNDRVMVDAAQTVNKLTMPDDLIFAVTMHNRTAIFGGINPTFFHLAHRKGWNVDLGMFKDIDRNILDKTREQLETRRKQGAKWLLISWYSPDLESPVDKYLPASAKTGVNPGIDGAIVFDMLKKYYPTVFQAKNFAVLSL